MSSNQQSLIKIITNDNTVFELKYFSRILGLIKFLQPILNSFIKDDTGDYSWEDILTYNDDSNIDPKLIQKPIYLPGVNKDVFSYLLYYCEQILVFKDKYTESLNAKQKNIEAISISSYSSDNEEVNARYVNLKFIKDREFIFFF